MYYFHFVRYDRKSQLFFLCFCRLNWLEKILHCQYDLRLQSIFDWKLIFVLLSKVDLRWLTVMYLCDKNLKDFVTNQKKLYDHYVVAVTRNSIVFTIVIFSYLIHFLARISHISRCESSNVACILLLFNKFIKD